MRLVQVALCRWKRTEGSVGQIMKQLSPVMARSNATKPSRICLRRASLSLSMAEVGGHRNSLRATGFSSPSPREAVGREGRREAEARVGGSSCNPHPGSLSLADPPHKGEGEETLRLGREA